MPELPEVETAMRGIERVLRGKSLSSVEIIRHDLRFAIPNNMIALLTGKTCIELKRRGKYIILIFTDNVVAILHLGMSGRIRIYDPTQSFERKTHDHFILTLNDQSRIVYHDPRRFGMFYLSRSPQWDEEKPFSTMGPEPLENWHGANLFKALRKKKSPIKTVLLDQDVVSGLGNIYVCEALFCAKISPLRMAHDLSKKECGVLVECSQNVLIKAIEAGGSTLRDYQKTDGSLGYFQYQFSVYDKEDEPCPGKKCRGTIKRIVQAGRSTFYCPICQK